MRRRIPMRADHRSVEDDTVDRQLARPIRSLQTSLVVGHSNDPLEHEAEATADLVMRRLARRMIEVDDDPNPGAQGGTMRRVSGSSPGEPETHPVVDSIQRASRMAQRMPPPGQMEQIGTLARNKLLTAGPVHHRAVGGKTRIQDGTQVSYYNDPARNDGYVYVEYQGQEGHVNPNYVQQDAGATETRDVQKAKVAFQQSEVRNYTEVKYQLFGNFEDNFGEVIAADWHGKPQDHLVNKWERAEGGEKLHAYDLSTDKAAAGDKTSAREAQQFKMDVEAYRKLPAWQKMQFAFLKYPNGPEPKAGYGNSYFVIKRSKAESDGVLHAGDSGVDAFGGSRGRFSEFPTLCETNLAARDLIQGRDHVGYGVEVQLAKGVRLPQDLDKFVVSNADLKAAVDVARNPQAIGPQPLPAAKTALQQAFGNVEYI